MAGFVAIWPHVKPGGSVRLRADKPVLIARLEAEEERNWSYLVPPAEIGKLPRGIAREEINENWKDVFAAKVKEIAGLYGLGCFKRWPRHTASIIIDARWVITWKLIEGNVGIICRLTVRGFKDKIPDPDTYAGTISRSGQRVVNVVAAENSEFTLVSFDVSRAFAKGMTFEELSTLG